MAASTAQPPSASATVQVDARGDAFSRPCPSACRGTCVVGLEPFQDCPKGVFGEGGGVFEKSQRVAYLQLRAVPAPARDQGLARGPQVEGRTVPRDMGSGAQATSGETLWPPDLGKCLFIVTTKCASGVWDQAPAV